MKFLLFSLIFVVTTAQAAEFTISVNKVGQVLTTSGETCPEGSLRANGQEVSKATYSKLYAVVADKYGVPQTSSNFKLPNYDSQFLRGADQLPGGREVGHKEDQATAVNGLHDLGHQHNINHNPVGGGGGGGDVRFTVFGVSYFTDVGYANLAGDSETRPMNVAVLYCVAY